MSQAQGSLEPLVRARVASWEYLRDIHHGDRLWMNVVALTPNDVDEIYRSWEGGDANATLESWFVLGSTLGRVLGMPLDGAELVRAVNQVLLELDFFLCSPAKQSVKLLMVRDQGHFPTSGKFRGATSTSTAAGGGTQGTSGGTSSGTAASSSSPSSSSNSADVASWAARAGLHKAGSSVVYEYLQVKHSCRSATSGSHVHVNRGMTETESEASSEARRSIERESPPLSPRVDGVGSSHTPAPGQACHELKYSPTEVVLALCEVLRQLYVRFLDPQLVEFELVGAIASLDATLRSLVLEPFCREANRVASATLKNEIATLDILVPTTTATHQRRIEQH